MSTIETSTDSSVMVPAPASWVVNANTAGHEQADRPRPRAAPHWQPAIRGLKTVCPWRNPPTSTLAPEDEQQVADDRARQRRLHDVDEAGLEREERDDELGDVAERRVEDAAHLRTGERARAAPWRGPRPRRGRGSPPPRRRRRSRRRRAVRSRARSPGRSRPRHDRDAANRERRPSTGRPDPGVGTRARVRGHRAILPNVRRRFPGRARAGAGRRHRAVDAGSRAGWRRSWRHRLARRRPRRGAPPQLGRPARASAPPPRSPGRVTRARCVPDDQHELAAGRDPPVGRGGRELPERAAFDRLVELGQLATDRAPVDPSRTPPPDPGVSRRSGSAPRTATVARSSRGDRHPAARDGHVRCAAGTRRTSSAVPRPRWPTMAASTADAPGIGTTAPPSPAQAAHQIRARVAHHAASRHRSRAPGPLRLQVLQHRVQPRRPAARVVAGQAGRDACRSSRRRVCRVSSAAMSGTARSVSIARRVMSPRLPMGVATTYSAGAAAGRAWAAAPTRPAGPSPRPLASPARRARSPARVQVVHAGRPRPQLGDGRDLALEFGARHDAVHPVNEVARRSRARSTSSVERRLSIRQNSNRSRTG